LLAIENQMQFVEQFSVCFMMTEPCFIMGKQALLAPTKTRSMELSTSEKFMLMKLQLYFMNFARLVLLPSPDSWQHEPDGNSAAVG
jgi:hypothetical protein